jgi:putative transposase
LWAGDKRKIIAADLRRIYTAATLDAAEQNFCTFEAQWNEVYPSIAKSWRNNWSRITPFYD